MRGAPQRSYSRDPGAARREGKFRKGHVPPPRHSCHNLGPFADGRAGRIQHHRLADRVRSGWTDDPGKTKVDWLDLAYSFATPLRPLIDALEGNQSFSTGSDGRLTFVLLGSDSRYSSVSRTDAMLIMSIKGNTITAASLPRDTGRVPRPASMGGGTLSGKANSILRQLMTGTTLDGALNKFDQVIENIAQIEVDYHALIWFNGFTTLVTRSLIIVNSVRVIYDGSMSTRMARRQACTSRSGTATPFTWWKTGANKHSTAVRAVQRSDGSSRDLVPPGAAIRPQPARPGQ